MCHKVRVRATQATTKIVSFLSKCIIAVCKFAIIAHVSVTFATVAIMSVSQHHATSEWFYSADIDYTTIKYLKRHSVFPWVVVILGSLVLTILDVVVIGTLLHLKKNIFCKQRLKYSETEKTEDKPPRTNKYNTKPQKGGQKHRLYPAIQSFKLHGT